MLIPQGQGGGLIPQAPQHRGMGLLPLIVGGLGAALGGQQFSAPFMGGFRAARFDERQAYEDQMRNWQLQQQQQRYNRQDALAEEKMRLAEAEREREARERMAQTSATIEALVADGMPREQAERLTTAGVAGDYLGPQEEFSAPQTINVGGKPMLVQQNLRTGRYQSIGGGGVTVNTGKSPEPLGADAADFRINGQPVDPRWTLEEALARGATPITDAEKKIEERRAQQVEAQANVARAEQEYEAALAEARENPRGDSARKVREAAQAVALARQDLLNLGRELSGQAQKELRPPGVLGRAVEDLATEAINLISPGAQSNVPAVPVPPDTPTTINPSGGGVINWADLPD